MKLPSILSATLIGVLFASVSVTPAFAEGSWGAMLKKDDFYFKLNKDKWFRERLQIFS